MKKPVFNSLGSNYSLGFMVRSAFSSGSSANHLRFQAVLAEHYSGQATLTYKGREALELALKTSDLPAGSAIGINGFTCYVVYRAILNVGYRPVFIDVAPSQMHFGLAELKTAHAKFENLSAIIVQNTLGYPADIKTLAPYCAEHKLMIIEDGAHSLGAVYEDGREVGTVGDFSMFSFSQDKPLDVVAGGAVIDRRTAADNKPQPALAKVAWYKREINYDYPFWTGLVRGSYSSGIGRWLHFMLKKCHLLATPMGDAGPGLHIMSHKAARLALGRWSSRQAELDHRRIIAKIYQKTLPNELQLVSKNFGQSSYLRFPLVTDNRLDLIKYLKKQRIYIGDTWYDAPLAPKRYMSQTDYQSGDCPRAEQLANHIVNLPTHINISEDQAEDIAGKVKQWHESQ